MKYNFDKMTDRRGTSSLKWDVSDNELPMWVADMDFETAPCIRDVVQEKVNLGIFGYSVIPDAWYDAYISWWSSRHSWNFTRESLIFCTGVIPAITCAVKRLTNVGDNVVIQTPVYDIFFHSVENQGRHVAENALKFDGRTYQIDFEDLEMKLSNPNTTLMILCNPQNPGGRIWTKEELVAVANLCEKHNVTIVSDEIHCDITAPVASYVPFATVSDYASDNSVICIAASKAFNMAGLQSAAVVIKSKKLHDIMERGLNSDEVAEGNIFAMDAAIAAFSKGGEWLDEMCEYVDGNRRLVSDFLSKELPMITLANSDASYLLWLNVRGILKNGDSSTDFWKFLREKTGLYVSKGEPYRGDGKDFLRLNIACPRERLLDGLSRLKSGTEGYIKAE